MEVPNDRSVRGFKTFLRTGGLSEWHIGYDRDCRISSRFVTAGGVVDTLTSPDPLDTDFPSLIEAHLQRAVELIKAEVKD